MYVSNVTQVGIGIDFTSIWCGILNWNCSCVVKTLIRQPYFITFSKFYFWIIYKIFVYTYICIKYVKNMWVRAFLHDIYDMCYWSYYTHIYICMYSKSKWKDIGTSSYFRRKYTLISNSVFIVQFYLKYIFLIIKVMSH